MSSANPVFESLKPDSVAAGLGAAISRFRIEVHPSLDSTNTELKRRCSAQEAIDGLTIAAETQTAGRGRHGRSWVDQPGRSLLFSLGWIAPLPVPRLAGLSLAVGVAVAAALETQGIPGLQLKWPNDVLFHHCKVGGILVETVNPAVADETPVIIGIGLNVALEDAVRDAVAAPVTDLRAAGWHGDRNTLLAALLIELGPTLDRFAIAGFQPFRAAWIARHALQRRNVTIWRGGNEVAAGMAIDVDGDGALLLQTPTGIRHAFQALSCRA